VLQGAVTAAPQIAPLLALLARDHGLAADRRQIEVDARPFRLRATASAAAAQGRVWLHPRLFDASGLPRPATRALLAHELVHLRQLQGPSAARAGIGAAELEAAQVAARVAEGWRAPRVRLALAPTAQAWDTGFDTAVGQRYGAEIARIKRLLRGVWGFLWVTDAMVDEILTILQAMDFQSAVALLAGAPTGIDGADPVSTNECEKLLDELDTTHRERFRPQVLALHMALEDRVLQRADASLFDGMDLHHLRRDEQASLVRTLGLIPAQARSALVGDDEERREIVARITGTPADYDAEAERSRLVQRLRDDTAERRAAGAVIEADPALNAQFLEVRRVLIAGPSESERLVLLDQLQPWMREPEKLRAVSLQLQQDSNEGDLFETWLDDFPVERIVAEPDRGGRVLGERRLAVLLRLLSHRDAWRNATFARDLATQSWFLDVVNDEEAWLAMQLIGLLPGDMRERLLADVGASMLDNLSVSQREAAGANYYRGGEGGRDLANLQAQMLDDALWTAEGTGRLAGLIRMAIAAREHAWVFRRSQIQHTQRRADYTDPLFTERIVEPFRLYNPEAVDADGQPAPRTTYSPQLLEGVPWYREGLLGDVDRYLIQTVDFMRSSGNVRLFRQSIGGENLNAVEFQDIFGGSFMGIRFADFESLGDDGSTALAAGRGANFIDDVAWDQSRGVLEMTASDLRVAAIRYPMGTLQFQTGGGRIQGLRLHMAYPTDQVQRLTSMSLHIDSLEVSDILLVGSDWMVAIGGLLAATLDVDLGQDAIGGAQDEARRGYDFWSVALLPNLSRLIGGSSGEQMSAGLLTPETPTALQVSIGSLTIDGVTTSGGFHAARVEAGGLTLALAGDAAGYVAALRRSQAALEVRVTEQQARHDALPEDPPRTAGSEPGPRAQAGARLDRLTAQRDATRAAADEIEAARARVAEAAPRDARGELSQEETATLAADRALLDRVRRGGAVFDAGRFSVQGLEGSASLEALELSDVHGMGSSSTALLGLLTGSDTLPRILQGEAHRPEVLAGREPERGDFSLDLGTIDLRGLTIRDAIPTPDEAQRDLDAAKKARDERPWQSALRTAVTDAEHRYDDAFEYARLAAIGISWLNSDETAQMRELHQRLSTREAFFAHHLHAEGAALTLSDSGRGVALSARQLDAFRGEDGSAGIRAGNLRIGEVHGTNVRAGMAVEGGLLAPPEGSATLRERLQSLGLAGESVEVLDFDDTVGGLHFDRALLEDFDLALDNEGSASSGSGDSARVHRGTFDAVAGRASIEGLRSDVSAAALQAEIDDLLDKPADRRTPSDVERLRSLQDHLAIFRGYRTLIADLNARVEGAASATDRREAETARADTLRLFERWRRQLGVRSATVHDLSVRVAGLGDVTDPRFDLDQALESGLLVTGTGRSADGTRSDRVFSAAEFSGGRFGAHEVERAAAGEMAGSVFYSNGRIELNAVSLASLELEGFYLEAGGNQVWNTGTSVLSGLSVTGALEFEPRAEHPEERYLSRVAIERLDIATVQGNGLSFFYINNTVNPPRQAMGEIESGTVGGIWVRNLEVLLNESGALSVSGSSDTVLREAGIRSLTDVRVNGMVQGALEFGRGRLNGSELAVTFLESGGERIAIGDLSLDEGEFRTADGHVRVTARHLSGSVLHEGSVWTLQGVTLPRLTVERLNWRSGSKTFVIEEPATLTGLSVDASVDTAVEGNPALHIERLHADGLTGGHFRYEEPPLTVEVRQQAPWAGATSDAAAFARPAIEVGAIDVADLRWSPRGGLPTTGTVDIASVHAALRVLKDDLDVGALVDTGSLFVGFRRDGMDVSAADIGVEASGTLADGMTVHAGVSGANTGLVRFFADRIEAPDLNLGRIELHQFAFENADYRVTLPEGGGRAALDGVTASVTVELDPAAASMTPTRIVIHHITVPTLTAAGLEVVLKQVDLAGARRDITLRLPQTPEATATDLHLGAADPLGVGFVLTPHLIGPTGETEWLAEGALGVGTFDAQAFGVEVQGLLNATSDVHVETLTVGRLASGDWSLDVRRIDLTQLTADAAGHHIEVLGLPPHVADDVPDGHAGVSLTGLTRSSGGDWGLESAALGGLVYRNPALGLTLEIASAQLPDGFTMPAGGAFTLPALQIDDAWFRLDDLSALLADSPGTAPAEPGFGVGDWNFLDALHGTVNFDLVIDWLPDLEIRLDIRDGVISYAELEDQLSLADAFVDFDYDDEGTLVLNLDWGNLIGPLPAMMPAANYAAITWSDLDPDDRQRAEEGLIRLSLVGNEIARLASEDAGDSASDESEASESGTGEDSDLAATLAEWVQIRNVMVDLSLRPTDIPLVQGDSEIGTLVLGGDGHDGVEGFRVRGDVPSQLQLAIDRIAVSTRPDSPLNFDGTSVGLGSVVVEGVRDVTIAFSGFKPGAMEGRIDSARAEDIVVQ
jgi:hypothetical protein